MKFAIYSRKSKYTGKGESIENQIEMCKQYINMKFNEIKDSDISVYEDEGFSGGNINRPNFQKMIDDAKRHKFDYIICYRLDRISRNIGDFAKLIEQLSELDISFVSIKEQFDTASPIGRAMMYIASVFSQLERETIAERIRDNMHELAKTGRWLGGNTPTGYKSEQIKKITVDGKTKKSCKLSIIEKEVNLVQLIYKKFLETNSLTMVETYLLQNHIKTKNDRNFTRFSIKNILQNPVYMIADGTAWNYFKKLGVDVYAGEEEFNGDYGIMAYNKTLQKSGKSNITKDISDWIIAKGGHKGLIEGADWIKVQNMLLQNKSKSYRKPRNNNALLAGLLYCRNCGTYMRPKLSSKTNEDGERVFSYLCEMKEKSHMHNCNVKNGKGNELDRVVCEEVKKLSGNNVEFVSQLKEAEKIIRKSKDICQNKLSNAKTSLRENENDINSLLESLGQTEGTPAKAYITNKINELHKKNISIKNEINELLKSKNSVDIPKDEYYSMVDILASFGEIFDTMNVQQKRTTLKAVIKRIEWDGEYAHIYL